ncbi:ATP-binding cassette domain-containing protein [Mucilaginibacter daejeonensis]|uniref:ABC transporter ATP-binding protein n=1 Tax=Mucilaginibacter daejeonensis TaxID=398049 RepID=UPI001D1703EE|nr:ABC transporter ATP-binding protein [Mucilaginibacter daejeonensis]UEG52977.1 ATP-binding cassette domain-containing protein [Mucilaginibacter daejeonensis]
MSNIAIKAENLSKAYQLGEFSTGTLSKDIQRRIALMRGKEDPYLKIGETNDRTTKGTSDIVWSLKDINFEIKQGDAVGVIGRNGAGKSTLLKVLSRVTTPTTGSVKIKGRIASLLEVGTGFHPELTGRENIFLNGAILGMRKHEIKKHFDAIVDFSGVERYIDTPVKRYSSGMYVRLAFAVAAHLESEIMIVDEVLAVGDAEFQKKCLGKMNDVSKGEGRTVLFVSHNMASIKNLCQVGIFLANGLVKRQSGIDDIINDYHSSAVRTDVDGLVTAANNENIEIYSLQFNNALQSNAINFDDPIILTLKGRASQRFSAVSLAINVRSTDNISLFTTRLLDSQESIILDGDFEIKVKIEHSLRAGNYQLALGIDSSINNIYINHEITWFEILDTGRSKYNIINYGIVNASSTWETC